MPEPKIAAIGRPRLGAMLWSQVLVVVAYLATGVLALTIFPISYGLAAVWPAAGVSVAAVLIAGPRVVLGVFLGDLLVGLYIGWPLASAAVLALAAVSEALVAWALLTRVFPIDARLARIKDVTGLILFGAVPAAILCVALRFVLAAVLGGSDPPVAISPLTLIAGLLGHGLGVLLLAPVILSWWAAPPARLVSGEGWLLFLAAIVLNAVAFAATPLAPGSAFLYAVFIVVLWAAVRFGPRETSVVMLVTGAFATWAAGRSSGPFIMSNQVEALYSLSFFLLVATATALMLAAAARERAVYLARVQASESAHRTLIEQMRDGVATLDSALRLNYVSDRFCTLMQRRRDALLGSPFDALFDPEDRAALEQSLERAGRGADGLAEARLTGSTAAPVVASVSVKRLLDADGQASGFLAVVSDVTERRRAADIARLRLQQLARMSRVQSMDEMAIAFAHEVAQPLTAITNYLQAAKRFLATGPQHQPLAMEALDGAHSEAQRGSAIVRRIRGFVQDRPSENSVVLADELVGEVAHLAQAEVRQLQASVTADLCGGLCRIWADPIQIQQVLLNLVRNAAEAMANAGSPTRHILLRCRPVEGGLMEFSVTDTGPGVAPEEFDKIFDPFFTTRSDGVGIGLALCRSIVESHGGRLWAEAAPAGGAVFKFTLGEYFDA